MLISSVKVVREKTSETSFKKLDKRISNGGWSNKGIDLCGYSTKQFLTLGGSENHSKCDNLFFVTTFFRDNLSSF